METDLVFRIGLFGLTLILIGVVTVVKVGMWWLRLALIDLLAVILLKQVAMISNYVGVDLFDDLISSFVTLLALMVILFAFIAAHQRKKDLERSERERYDFLQQKNAQTLEELEQMRSAAEKRGTGSWDWQIAYPLDSRPYVYEVRQGNRHE
jgi:hypothetical protein